MVRVYIACSFDGFIAGVDDDLSWLPTGGGEVANLEPGAVGFAEFMAGVGALLMGRRTYDVAAGFGGAWPYGDTPVLVATHRALDPVAPAVRAVTGEITEVVAEAKRTAGDKDVYLDGGALIRQALDAGLVDDLVVTLVPVLLGAGHPLFAGVTQRHDLEIRGHYRFGDGMLQIHARPRR